MEHQLLKVLVMPAHRHKHDLFHLTIFTCLYVDSSWEALHQNVMVRDTLNAQLNHRISISDMLVYQYVVYACCLFLCFRIIFPFARVYRKWGSICVYSFLEVFRMI